MRHISSAILGLALSIPWIGCQSQDSVWVARPSASSRPYAASTAGTPTSASRSTSNAIIPSEQAPIDEREPERVPPVRRENSAPENSSAGGAEPEADEAETELLKKYVLRPGDRLELLYTESWAVEGTYRLLPGDKINVEYLHLMGVDESVNANLVIRPSGLDRTLTVAPDGKVSLPYLGGVEAAGMTIGELTDRLNARYQAYFLEPQMLVTLVETGSRLKDLREAIRTGGSRLVTISPEGSVNLPHVGEVRAVDLTLGELQAELTERYRRSASGLAVTARLARPAARRTNRPGAIPGSLRSSSATPISNVGHADPANTRLE